MILATLILFGAGSASEAPACVDATMRDAAFDEPRDVHRLCVIANSNDPAAQKIHQRLADWSSGPGKDLNVEVLRVDPQDAEVRWSDYGIPSAPPSLPVVVLAGWRTRERESFYIHHWEPGPTVEDLEFLRTSPATEAIRREVGRRLALLLYVRGTDSEAGSDASIIDAVSKKWSSGNQLGVPVVRVDRSDPRERLLLSFAGVAPSGPDWVCVVFGRGKFMHPLVGRDINEVDLNTQIESVAAQCTCLQSPSSLGVDVPMMWDSSLDAAVIPLAGSKSADGSDADTAALADMRMVVQARTLATTMWTLGALVLVVVLSTLVIVWRKNRKDAVCPAG